MKLTRPIGTALCVVLLSAAVMAVLGEYTTPNVIATPGDVTAALGSTIVTNHGLVGVGRISASTLDGFAESFGSVSSLQVTDWVSHGDGSYGGTFNILPDRGYNVGNFYSDYAARINQIGFTFTPYTGASNIGGTTDLEKLQAQSQIAFTTPVTGVKFTYDDPITLSTSYTTGLDPVGNSTVLFGKPMPYVTSYTGLQSPSAAGNTTYTNINKLALDSEALIINADGSGYVGDEYGANIYYFDSTKKIVGAIVPPAALQPHVPAGTLSFSSASTPVNGRRNNQGFEGVSLSPDGTRLFALLQSAAVQDGNPAANDQNSKNTRLLIYDVTGSPTPAGPVAEYALVLPTYRTTGNGGAVNSTAAQSEVVALDDTRFLVLSRDGNGLGKNASTPTVYKSVLLVDTTVGTPSNLVADAGRNVEGGKITTAPGVLDASITPLSWVEVVNMLNTTQLSRFNVSLDTGGQVSKLTLGEKWEGLSLVPAHDPTHPNDYFLFVGNDNDFLTSDGFIKGPDGTIVGYDGFNGYPGARVPAPVDSLGHENDTIFLAYRLTIISGATLSDATPPAIVPLVAGTSGTNGWYTSSVTVSWTVTDPESGIASLSGCGPATLTADTAAATLTCAATNGAGLTASVPAMLKIDKTPPLVTTPANQTVQQLTPGGTTVTYAVPIVVEAGSGLASSGCLPASGSVFAVGSTNVTCTAIDLAGNTGSATFTVTVTPAPDGRIFGAGRIDGRRQHQYFVFRVSQIRNQDYGRLEFWAGDLRPGAHDDDDLRGDRDRDYGRDHRNPPDRFEATSVGAAIFSDDPGFQPGRAPRPTVDTVRFSGVGRWNGRPGYRFDAVATDQGEGGRHRDTFSLVVRDPRGKIVAEATGDLDRGNIQSTRLGR